MTEASKRSLKFFAGCLGMAPLVAVLAMLVYPESFPVHDLPMLRRGLLAAFMTFVYCFGLTKWVFPNG